MDFRRNHSFLFTLFASNCFFGIVTSGCFYTQWTPYITNRISDDIVVHIKSTDHDLGNHTIPSNDVYKWTFCEKLIGTHFTGDFWWGARYQSLALMDRKIINFCRIRYFGAQECFWLIMPDGFYVSNGNGTFPYGWVKKKSW